MRRDRLDEPRVTLAHRIEQVADLIGAEQLLRTNGKELVDVCRDDAFRVNHQVSFGDGQIAHPGIDPQRRTAEARIACLFALQSRDRPGFARIDGQHLVGTQLTRTEGSPAQHDAIAVRRQIEAVADTELRHDEAKRLAELPPQTGQPGDKRSSSPLVGKMHQAEAKLDGDQRLLRYIVDRDPRRIGLLDRLNLTRRRGLASAECSPQRERAGRHRQEYCLRHRRDKAHRREDAADREPDTRICQLAADLSGKVAGIRNAGDYHRGGDREQQGRHRRNQRIADRKRDIALPCFGGGEAV